MDAILDAHPPALYPKLPRDAAAEFEACAFDSLALATAVANHYMVIDPKRLFNVTIKCHYIAHIGERAKYINPRLAMCYSGEDWMHHMKRLVQSSVRGKPPKDVNKKMCDKICHAMHMKLTDSQR